YREAKRLLKLAMTELRGNAPLRSLGMDPASPGRGAIKGDGAPYVWDFVRLTDHPAGKAHTGFPHLTLAVHGDHLEVAISIPDGMSAIVRRRLIELGTSGLQSVSAEVLRRAAPMIARGAWVEAFALQRHYPSQSSQPIVDALVRFKLETSQSAF